MISRLRSKPSPKNKNMTFTHTRSLTRQIELVYRFKFIKCVMDHNHIIPLEIINLIINNNDDVAPQTQKANTHTHTCAHSVNICIELTFVVSFGRWKKTPFESHLNMKLQRSVTTIDRDVIRTNLKASQTGVKKCRLYAVRSPAIVCSTFGGIGVIRLNSCEGRKSQCTRLFVVIILGRSFASTKTHLNVSEHKVIQNTASRWRLQTNYYRLLYMYI